MFDYKKLVRDEKTYKSRHYICPETGELIPSVTTILDATADKSFLVEWRKRIGNVEADRQVKYASNLGTILHTHMEAHVLGEARPDHRGKPIFALAKKMADAMITGIGNDITKVYGSEIGLYMPSLYAGTTDLVGEYRKKPAIMDFKNSKKIKKKEQITDYFCQCCAYALAHNYLYGTNIRTVAILMVDRELNFKEFVIEDEEFDSFCEIWMNRVEQFLALPRV